MTKSTISYGKSVIMLSHIGNQRAFIFFAIKHQITSAKFTVIMKVLLKDMFVCAPLMVCILWLAYYCKNSLNGNASQRILCLYFLITIYIYLYKLNHLSHNIQTKGLADVAFSLSNMLVYPIFYLYIVSLTGRLKKNHFLTFVPAVLISLAMTYGYYMTPDNNLELKAYNKLDSYIFWLNYNKILNLIENVVIHISIVFSFYFGSMRLFNSKKKLNSYISNLDDKNFNRLRNSLTLFAINTSLTPFMELTNEELTICDSIKAYILITISAILLFFVGYYGFMKKNIIVNYPIPKEEHLSPTAQDNEPYNNKNNENMIYLKDLAKRIEDLMNKEHLFLKPDLKVVDIAVITGSNKTYIFRALKLINEGLSFPDYINRFRLKYSVDLMKRNQNITLAEISIASGFNTESTFYRAFKKEFGMSPRQFMSSM